MTLSVKHAFVTGKGDGPDTTRVKPTNWNAEHAIVTDGDGVVLGRSVGSGPGPIQDLPISSLFPTGVILPYAGSTPPDANWLLCFGQLLSRTVEAALFAAIGTAYGAGDGATTFAAPDGRGAALVGKTNMGGADRGNLPGGSVLGAYLGGPSVGGLPVSVSGTVGVNFGNVQLAGGVAQNPSSSSFVPGGGGVQVPDAGCTWAVYGYTPINGNFGVNSSGNTTAGFSVVQPSLVTNFIIKR